VPQGRRERTLAMDRAWTAEVIARRLVSLGWCLLPVVARASKPLSLRVCGCRAGVVLRGARLLPHDSILGMTGSCVACMHPLRLPSASAM
jgi:hypothetical protein